MGRNEKENFSFSFFLSFSFLGEKWRTRNEKLWSLNKGIKSGLYSPDTTWLRSNHSDQAIDDLCIEKGYFAIHLLDVKTESIIYLQGIYRVHFIKKRGSSK